MVKEIEQVVIINRIICDGCDKCIADDKEDKAKYHDMLQSSASIDAFGKHFCNQCHRHIREWVREQQIRFVSSGEIRKYVQKKTMEQKEPDILNQLRTGKIKLNPGEY